MYDRSAARGDPREVDGADALLAPPRADRGFRSNRGGSVRPGPPPPRRPDSTCVWSPTAAWRCGFATRAPNRGAHRIPKSSSHAAVQTRGNWVSSVDLAFSNPQPPVPIPIPTFFDPHCQRLAGRADPHGRHFWSTAGRPTASQRSPCRARSPIPLSAIPRAPAAKYRGTGHRSRRPTSRALPATTC